MKICLATNNKHKVDEIRNVLGKNYEILTLKEMGCEEELPETGNTLEANSLEKAQYIFNKYRLACIADDSGLEIMGLGLKPGVDSAHYAGPQRNADDNMNLVLNQLKGINDRSAVFKTVITYIDNYGVSKQFVGIVEGNILEEKRGNNGFGYDPIFLPSGFTKTFAEMVQEEKNSISHRSRALVLFHQFLSDKVGM